jgi:hypothetical protein
VQHRVAKRKYILSAKPSPSWKEAGPLAAPGHAARARQHQAAGLAGCSSGSGVAAPSEALTIGTRREAGGGSAAGASIVMETALAAAKLGAAEQLAQALDAKAEAANARDAEGAQAARRGTDWCG